MLSDMKFVRQSLELHLFYLRIMKEHLFFFEASFMPRDVGFRQQANLLRIRLDELLAEVITLSNGIISPEVLQSGEMITPYTLKAETVSANLTGIPIATQLTQAEAKMTSGQILYANPNLEQRVASLNQRAISLVTVLIQVISTVLSNVLSCKMFTTNYPLLIDHVLRETKLYLRLIQKLQETEDINIEKEMYEYEAFWNRIMSEHSKFIRGLLDPTEETLIETANLFSKEFEKLRLEALAAMERAEAPTDVTAESLEATKKLRDFKATGTQGILNCKIKSIIIPLLSDHVLREANHYLRLLKKFATPMQ